MMTPTEPVSFISIQAFAKRASLSRGTIYNLVNRGEAPKPVTISQGRVGFLAHEVEAWFAEKIAAR